MKMRGEIENVREMDEEKVKKIRSDRYNAEVVNFSAAPRTILNFVPFFFFRGALESGEGNKLSPHKTSRPTLFNPLKPELTHLLFAGIIRSSPFSPR